MKQQKVLQIPYVAALVLPLPDATSRMTNGHENQCGEHNKKCYKYPMWLHWFFLHLTQHAAWRTSVRISVENIWQCVKSCIAKTDICLLWGNMLTKERIFVLKTYYATRSYHCVKEAFHTEFPNSLTTLSDSSILLLVRKFKVAGSVQEKPQKERPHTATTTECVKKRIAVVISSICCNDFVYIYWFCMVFRVSLARLMPHPALFRRAYPPILSGRPPLLSEGFSPVACAPEWEGGPFTIRQDYLNVPWNPT